MSSELVVRNHQRELRVNSRWLARVARHLLEEELGLGDYMLGVQFVSARRMAAVNWQFLQHEGSTDVITFDYVTRPDRANETPMLHGELFICPAVAKTQAKEFGTSMHEELVRYIIHGVLHLRGFDDRTTAVRKVMKREEARLLRRLRLRVKLSRPHTTSH